MKLSDFDGMYLIGKNSKPSEGWEYESYWNGKNHFELDRQNKRYRHLTLDPKTTLVATGEWIDLV